MNSPKPESTPIPLQYLLETSHNILGEYQLSRLDRATQLKREIRDRQERMIDNLVEAALAMYLRENRERIIELCSRGNAPKLLEGG